MNTKKRIDEIEKMIIEAADSIMKIRDELKPKPEFKVGDWVISNEDYSSVPPRRLAKGYGNLYIDDKGYAVNINTTKYHYATEKDIKAHLIKKYHKDYPDNRFDCLEGQSKGGNSAWKQNKPSFIYYINGNELWVENINYYDLCVYQQGKWAEPIKEQSRTVNLNGGNTAEINTNGYIDVYYSTGITVSYPIAIIKELYKAITK